MAVGKAKEHGKGYRDAKIGSIGSHTEVMVGKYSYYNKLQTFQLRYMLLEGALIASRRCLRLAAQVAVVQYGV